MDKKKIIETLAPMYRAEFDAYEQLSLLAKEAAHDGDDSAFEALKMRADKKSCFLDGVMAAAKALGIDFRVFMEGVNRDEGREDEKSVPNGSTGYDNRAAEEDSPDADGGKDCR